MADLDHILLLHPHAAAVLPQPTQNLLHLPVLYLLHHAPLLRPPSSLHDGLARYLHHLEQHSNAHAR